MPTVNPAHQLQILARLSEFCHYQGATLNFEREPWEYMRRKLTETEGPIQGLKGELFAAAKSRLVAELKNGAVSDERFAQFKDAFEKLLAPGDFADVAIHLSGKANPQARQALVTDVLGRLKPTNIFEDERKPAAERSPAWERLIAEMNKRLEIEPLETIMRRKPMKKRRKPYVLRRLRRNVAEYATVLRIPTEASDTFTPFILPRVEALVASCLRFLNRYR